MGEKDYCFKFPGMEDYIRSGAVKHFVPDLEIIYIPEGSHFVHEQYPEKVNQLIIEFFDKQNIWLCDCRTGGKDCDAQCCMTSNNSLIIVLVCFYPMVSPFPKKIAFW